MNNNNNGKTEEFDFSFSFSIISVISVFSYRLLFKIINDELLREELQLQISKNTKFFMSFFTIQQLERMAEIVNKAISRAGFENINVAPADFDRDSRFSGGGFIKWADENNNPISMIFNKAAINRIGDKGQFFHFKSYEIAKQIISNRSIQMSNLLSNEENDFAEFSEFYKRLGLFHQLIPKDYLSQLSAKTYRPGSGSEMDEIRDNILILCFSKDRHNEQFWDAYAKSETGVCLTFRFEDLNYEKFGGV